MLVCLLYYFLEKIFFKKYLTFISRFYEQNASLPLRFAKSLATLGYSLARHCGGSDEGTPEWLLLDCVQFTSRWILPGKRRRERTLPLCLRLCRRQLPFTREFFYFKLLARPNLSNFLAFSVDL